MKEKTIVADICFADDADQQNQDFISLFQHYAKSGASSGKVLVTIGVDGDDFIIKVSKGFDCLTFDVSEIKKLLEGR